MSALDELYARRDRLRAEIETQKGVYEREQSPGALERLGNLKRGLEAAELSIISRLAENPAYADFREDGIDLPGSAPRAATRDDSPGASDRDSALRLIEERSNDVLSSTAADRLDAIVRRDRFGVESRWLSAISSDSYYRAWAKQLFGVSEAEKALTPDESEAMLEVGRAEAERALGMTGEVGGYAVPFVLDPSVLLISDSAINPIRQLATVTPITNSNVWKGVSSVGTEFEFAAEAAEAEDAELKLKQPEIAVEKAQILLLASIEIFEDWAGIGQEVAKILSDARDIKEAEVFAVGKGAENIPQGLITGATKTVTGSESKKIAIADIYAVQEDLPARWQPRAVWLGTNSVANEIHQMVATADSEHASLMSEDRSSILGKSYKEVSTMSSKTTTEGELVLAYGDVGNSYRIVDRLGMRVETIPHVMNGKKASGQRAFYGYVRFGAKCINPDGMRVLKVKA